MKKYVWFLTLIFLLSLSGIALSDPPDFVPPGHKKEGNATATSNATGIGVGIGVGIGQGGTGGAGGAGGSASVEVQNNIGIDFDQPTEATVNLRGGAGRPYPDTVQPTLPGFVTQDPKSSGIAYLNDLSRLPPKINLFTVQRMTTLRGKNDPKLPKCNVRIIPRDGAPDNPRFFPDYVKLYSVKDDRLIHVKYVLGLPVKEEGVKFQIIGDIVANCEDGSHFDLDVRVREKIMIAGGNGVIYFQAGKKEDISATSIGLGLGGVSAQLGGSEQTKAISVSGFLGLAHGSATVNEIPGLMGHALLVHEGGW